METDRMKPEDLLQALCSIRRRLRLLLVIDGVAHLLGWAAVLLALFALLDWSVHFPWFVRLTVLLVAAGWATFWSLRHIIRPALATISLDQLALRLGRLTPKARDRLATAVAYLRKGGEGSPQLWHRVVANTLRSVGEVPLAVGLSPRRAIRSALIAMVVLCPIALLQRQSPATFSTGWHRVILPLTPVRWPKRVRIAPISGDAVVAFGENFTAKMRIDRGNDPDLRAYLIAIQPAGGQRRSLMRRDDDGIYRYVMEDLRRPTHYAFAAGDDDTLDRPFGIEVFRRPAVASARLVLDPPDYARGPSAFAGPLRTIQALDDAPLVAVAGSHARLEVVPNHPLAGADGMRETASGSQPILNHVRFDGGRRIALLPADAAASKLVAEFVVSKGGAFEIRLLDARGLESASGRRYQLLVREDQGPMVVLTAPAGDVELTPRGVLTVAVRATDDFGIENLRLLAGMNGEEPIEVADLLAETRDEERQSARQPSGNITARRLAANVYLEYAWRLGGWRRADAPVPIKPGDVIEYVVEARDRFRLNGQRHRPARSSVARIRIVSAAELAELLRQALFDARRPLRQLLARLQAVRDRTASLDRGPAAAKPLTDEQKEDAVDLARQLDRLASQGRQAAGRFDRIWDRAEMNRASHTDVAIQAGRLARSLLRLSGQNIKDAASRLSHAVESDASNAQHEKLAASLRSQEKLIAAMGRMLAELERWNEFADCVRQTRALLDRQESLSREVARLGRTLGGHSVSQLEATRRSALERASALQSQLKADADAVVRNAGQLATTLGATDRAAAEALHRAVEVFGAAVVGDEMEQAAEEIRRNRMNRAGQHQQRAAAGLRAMLAALDEKPDRELADLSRELEDILGRLERLIRAQLAVIDRTRAAQGPATGLIKRQRSLLKTARAIESSMKPKEYEAIAAKAEMLEAAARMETAIGRLERSGTAPAVQAERQAMISLKKARALLQTLGRRTERLMAERSLAAILDALVSLRESQSMLKVDTGVIEQHRRKRGRISRADGLKLNRMAKDQRGLLEPLKTVRSKIQRSVVFQHVCDRVKAAVESAAKMLRGHDCPKAVVHQNEVLRNLDRLIGAIEDQPARDRRQFVETSGGEGGGPGSPTVAKPVPTLAELKVLRMLQVDLVERTRRLSESLPDPLLRSEAQLTRIERLGIEQGEVHDLSVRMIQAAAEPQTAGDGGR